MGTQKAFMSDTHLDWMNSGSVTQVFYLKMMLFVRFCWYFMRASLFGIFGLLSRYFLRFQFKNSIKKDESSLIREEDEINGELKEMRFHDQAPEAIDFSKYDGFGERDSSSNFTFKFQFHSQEEIRRIVEESEVRFSEEKKFTSTAEIHDCTSVAEKAFIGFNDEPEVMNFSIKESPTDSEGETSSGTKEIPDIEFEDEFLLDRELKQENSAMEEAPSEEIISNSCTADGCETEQPNTSEATPPIVGSGTNNSGVENMAQEVNFVSEREFSAFDSDPESISLSDGLSVMNQITESDRNDFPSDNAFRRLRRQAELQERMQNSEVSRWRESFVSDTESVDFSDGFSPINDPIDIYKLYVSDSESLDFSERSSSVMNRFDDSVLSAEFLSEKDFPGSEIDTDDFDSEIAEFKDELRELEETQLENSRIPVAAGVSGENEAGSSNQSDGFLSEEDFGVSERDLQDEDGRTTRSVDELCESGETQFQDSSNSDSDESDGFEYLWEEQDLMDQLRTEIKKVRETGLPTILEESDDVKMIDDLKPWKIDEKFLQEDPLDEMQKFYKSYRERMRKLDILNYQKMYAIGFLQLKDPLESISSRKSSTPKLSSLLSTNLLRRHHRKSETIDPTAKFIQELQVDLETVYVGQTCLSWEFLHWQYEKSHELSDSDPHNCRQYNQVAGEFQQFQVLLQRFLENEPFQGPRVQTYVKTRCVFKNLLQVPEIKEDCLKERMQERRKGNEAITSEMLMTIIDESMDIFWQFVKADKDETNAILKLSSRTKTQLEDPADSQLFEEVQAELLKREKKLKDLLRTGNCLVKKFQKPRGDQSSHRAYFFSQVDLRLVSRVLRMSRITTDQLLWCRRKLNKVAFHDRKLHREPSFLLFPCC